MPVVHLKVLSLLILFCLLSQRSFSQHYVITSSGDTIRGSVTTGYYEMVVIKDLNKKRHKFKPKKARAFFDGKHKYLSRAIERSDSGDTAQYFVAIVDSGAVNLLSTNASSGSGFVPSATSAAGFSFAGGGNRIPEFYVERRGEVSLLRDVVTRMLAGEKRKQDVRDILLGTMNGDDLIAEKIKSIKKFDPSTLKTLVEEYNSRHR